MITISLDEYGEFEKEDKKPLFIAGLIFDDKELPGEIPTEERTERERIRAYYRQVISDAGTGFSYPEDLHSNGDSARDHHIIKPVKMKVAETLPEFIQRGTYDNKPLYNEAGNIIRARRGTYHLFVILKSNDGKKRLLSANANMLAKDDWAANRYFHMAGSVVNRIIFHNPLYPQGHAPAIKLDIATRSTGNIGDMDTALANEFKLQSYKAIELNNSNHRFYSIMNADIYRTLIAQEMVSTENVSVRIESLSVKSIQYDPNKTLMEFLYLSDSLCSILGYDLKGENADDWLTQIIDQTTTINPHEENLVFGYDEIDNDFSKAWRAYENRNLYEALSVTYDAKIKTGKFAEHYRDVWFPYLEEKVREIVTPELFTKNVNDLSASLTVNNLDQEKLLYLMLQFELMVERISDMYKSIDMKSITLYKLYDAGVSAFCHIGNAAKALEYYEKCRQYAYYVGMDAYLNTNNKLIVCLEDSFQWDKALEIAQENVSNQQLASEMKREVWKRDTEADFLDEAKSISQLARIFAEKRDPQAEIHFRTALGKLQKGSANYKITQSYLLHYYADMNMQAAFDEEAKDYFDGRDNYNQRLKYIVRSGEKTHSVFSKEYALYVLIRGLFYFHQEEIDDTLWKKLYTLDETLTQNDKKAPGGHPWEIIYKYLEMLAISRNDEAAREKFKNQKSVCLKYKGATIEALEQFGDAETADLAKDYTLRDTITKSLSEYMKENFEAAGDTEFSADGTKRYQELQKYFTFMYR